MSDQPARAASRLAGVFIIATAVVVIVAGIVFLILAASVPQQGWFAYAPLSGHVFRPNTTGTDLLRSLGFGLIVLGVAVAATTAGYLAARRKSTRRTADASRPATCTAAVAGARPAGSAAPAPAPADPRTAAGGATSPVRLQRSNRLTPAVEYAYSSSVAAVHELVFFAGACPLNSEGAIGAPGDFTGQAQLCIQNLLIALDDAGCRLENIASTRLLVASSHQPDLWAAWNVVRDAFDAHDVPSTLLGVTALGYPGQLVELEAVAAR